MSNPATPGPTCYRAVALLVYCSSLLHTAGTSTEWLWQAESCQADGVGRGAVEDPPTVAGDRQGGHRAWGEGTTPGSQEVASWDGSRCHGHWRCWGISCFSGYYYTVNRQYHTNMFFGISSTKPNRFWWNLVHVFGTASQVCHTATDGGATASAIHCRPPSIRRARPHGLELFAGRSPRTGGLWVL